MNRRLVRGCGFLLLGVMLGLGYVRQRDNDVSLLASVVGDYSSSVSYKKSGQELLLFGQSGGSSDVNIFVMYDPKKVSLVSIDSPYVKNIGEDENSWIRVSLSSVDDQWDDTPLATLHRSGSMNSLSVSEVTVPNSDGSDESLSITSL